MQGDKLNDIVDNKVVVFGSSKTKMADYFTSDDLTFVCAASSSSDYTDGGCTTADATKKIDRTGLTCGKGSFGILPRMKKTV